MSYALAEIAVAPLEQLLTYKVPDNLHRIEEGHKVRVPLGRRETEGYVIRTSADQLPAAESSHALKEIIEIVHADPIFTVELMKFIRWAADYYLTPLSAFVDLVAPPTPKSTFRTLVTLRSLPHDGTRIGDKEKAILQLLKEERGPVEATTLNRVSRGYRAILKKLEEKGLIALESVEVRDRHVSTSPIAPWARREVILSPEQSVAVTEIERAVDAATFTPFLLQGVTGSGKTEVYIETARHTLAKGRSVLILVPEIALTPQLIDRVRARLDVPVAALHSSLSDGARWDAWRAMRAGEIRVALGARSCLFAPLQNIGLIVVDEEHEGSYKQSDRIRYHARDLALMRAKLGGMPIVLGSATPSIETYHHATTGRYRLLTLDAKHGAAPPPRIEIINLCEEKPWTMAAPSISSQLNNALRDVIASRQQAFVLYNRRGFASYLQCDTCGAALTCHLCSVTYTYHKNSHSLVCHYCGSRGVPPTICPHCPPSANAEAKAGALVHRGSGTERIVEELTELFPDVVIERLDRDSVTSIVEYRALIDRLRAGEIQILVGTQMIAKGHDIPNVTLVGVVDCDVGLHLPDFRASERIFQLLTQVAGRSGRGDALGNVLLQTRLPKHESLQATLHRNYQGFAAHELAIRKALKYPPFVRLARLIAVSTDQGGGIPLLRSAKQIIDTHFRERGVICVGPAPAPLSRIRGEWRAHLLVKSESIGELHAALTTIDKHIKVSAKTRLIIDVDPQEML